jgi:hypothetical protein
VGRDRNRENAGRGQPGDEDEQRVRETCHKRVAPTEPDELGVGCVDPRQRLVRAAVGDELGRTAKQLDELRRERGASLRLAASRAPRQRSGQGRHDHTARK